VCTKIVNRLRRKNVDVSRRVLVNTFWRFYNDRVPNAMNTKKRSFFCFLDPSSTFRIISAGKRFEPSKSPPAVYATYCGKSCVQVICLDSYVEKLVVLLLWNECSVFIFNYQPRQCPLARFCAVN